jgi:hypothetical protein
MKLEPTKLILNSKSLKEQELIKKKITSLKKLKKKLSHFDLKISQKNKNMKEKN